MKRSHFPLRYLQGSCKNGGHLRVGILYGFSFRKRMDVGPQQLTKALKKLGLPRKGGSRWIVSFVRPHQAFFRGKFVKVLGEVLTCCWRYGRPMDKGILQGGPLLKTAWSGKVQQLRKKKVPGFLQRWEISTFFLAEHLTIFEFDFLEADFFLLPFEPLGGSFLWVSFITCPPIFLPFPPFFFGRERPSFSEANKKPG